MSPATLPRLPALDLDARRIAATSATIAVHLLALMLLLAPMQYSPPAPIDEPNEPIWFEEKPIIKIDPPPVPPREITRTPPAPTQQPPVMEQLVEEVKESCSAAVLDGPEIVYVLRVPTHKIMRTNLGAEPIDTLIADTAITDSTEGEIGPPVEVIDIGPPPSGPMPLATRIAPAPDYPTVALRQGVEGRVVLRIEVDAGGVPTGGSIERSSGSNLLDRTAIDVDSTGCGGTAATNNTFGEGRLDATALVPVDFVINQ